MELLKTLGLEIPKNTYDKNFTQDYIPIKDIEQGVIITNDERYIKIMEILPINLSLKPLEEQDRIINNYAKALSIMPNNCQIKTTVSAANTSGYIAEVREILKKEDNENCKRLAENYLELIRTTGSSSSVERHFYLIFEYEPERRMLAKTDVYDIIKELNNKEREIEQALSICGNMVVKTRNPDKTVAQFLYDYYNPRSKFHETFNDRLNRTLEDIRKLNEYISKDSEEFSSLYDIPVDIRDIIAPRSIDFSNPNYVIVDGIYETYIPIDGNSIQNEVIAGWLSEFIGVPLDIHINRLDAAKFYQKVKQKLKFSTVKLNSRNETQDDYEEIEANISSSRYFMQNKNSQTPYDISIIMTVYGRTLEELMSRKDAILYAFKLSDLDAVNIKYNIEETFDSVAPFCNLNPKIAKLTHRNTMTEGIACSYPYTAFELSDKGGIVVGTNLDNSSIAIINPFDTSKYTNANISICGRTGAGKSYLMQLLALRFRYIGIQNFIIAPDKQDEFRRSCRAIGGTFVDISPSSSDCINLFDIRPSESPANEYLNGEGYINDSWLNSKIQDIIIFMSLLVPDLSYSETSLLETLLMNIYKQKGITSDNLSIYIDPENKSKGIKEMPIIEDLYNELNKSSELRKEIADTLSQFVTGSARSFNGQTNVDLNNKHIVFGIEKLSGTKLLSPGMFIALSFIWDKVKEDKTAKKAIFIDEGWQLIDGSNENAAKFVERIFKVIRGWGGSAIFATQSLNDLFKSEKSYGSSIISCSQIKLILGLDDSEIKYIANTLNISANEQDSILTAKKGQALLCAGSNHIRIKAQASPVENMLITTDREELAYIHNNRLLDNFFNTQ